MSITRRSVLTTAGATFLLPTFLRSAWAALDTQAWIDITAKEYSFNTFKYVGQGYNTISLCTSGDGTNARFAVVMAKAPQQIAEKPIALLPADQFQMQYDGAIQDGFQPVIVSATGPAASAVFSGIFWKSSVKSFAKPNLTLDQLRQLNGDAQQVGNSLWWLDAYGDSNDERFVAVWGPNLTKEPWTCEEISEATAQFQDRFNAQLSGGVRLARIVMTPAGRYLGIFADSTIGAWTSWGDMTKPGYLAKVSNEKAAGRVPVQIASKGAGTNAKFAAIFTSRLDIDQRKFQAVGPVTVDAIDNAIKGMMAADDLRGAALAVTKGTRLVYVKGYTYAEPGYPPVQPTTPFRLASCSKIFTAVAIYQILQEKQKSGTPPGTIDDSWLDTPVQTILNLKQPNGSAPTDSVNFPAITVRHLLEHKSGLDPNLIFRSTAAAKIFGVNPPPTSTQLARYAATKMLPTQPGTGAANYNNFGYFMLSQVVAKVRNKAFEVAVASMLGPLTSMLSPPNTQKPTLVREATSLVSNQPKDEARYHLRRYEPTNGGGPLYPLQVALSAFSSHLVPFQYGGSAGNINDPENRYDWVYELFDGAGGISAAVIDMARLIAMFSLRTNNPVLKPETIDKLLANAAANSSHGFDQAKKLDPATASIFGVPPDQVGNSYNATKGGWVYGAQSFVNIVTGGYSSVLLVNGNKPSSGGYDWVTPVGAAVLTHNWGAADLFKS